MFVLNEELWQQLDFQLLQDGPISLFWRRQVLDETRAELRALGYAEIFLEYQDFELFKQDLSESLQWSARFGYAPWDGNLDALNDGLTDPGLGWEDAVILCIANFHEFVARDAEYARAFLNVVARGARYRLLFGSRLIALIQTADNRYRAPALGGQDALWNPREWLDAHRGL